MRTDVEVIDAVTRLEGPLLFLKRTVNTGLNEAVEVEDSEGHVRLGRVVTLDEEIVTIEVLESTAGLGLSDTRVRFTGESLHFALGPGILGRVFDGVGRVIDGGPPVSAEKSLRIDGLAISPAARATPRDFIETGISSIDLMNSLVRGQKLPIFSGAGLPHDRLAMQIAHPGAYSRYCCGRVRHGICRHWRTLRYGGIFSQGHGRQRSAGTCGVVSEPCVRLQYAAPAGPRYALTAAEYLAFMEGKHVLAILTDMTNYCEALREVATAREEVPGRRGYPGYMYTDLATIYERAGRLRGHAGSVTQLIILSMPDDDITHPIPDLSGYINRRPDRAVPRAAPSGCLSAYRRAAQSEPTHECRHRRRQNSASDHRQVADQLYALYAVGRDLRRLVAIIGVASLSASDSRYLEFADAFEKRFVNQDRSRSITETLDIAWDLLRMFPEEDLKRIDPDLIAAYLH